MRHSGTIVTIGIILIIIPFLGLPAAWKSFFITASGLWLFGIVLSAHLSRHQIRKTPNKKESRPPVAPFVENQAPLDTPKESVSQNIHDQFPQA